jgi:hypothetical protein
MVVHQKHCDSWVLEGLALTIIYFRKASQKAGDTMYRQLGIHNIHDGTDSRRKDSEYLCHLAPEGIYLSASLQDRVLSRETKHHAPCE